MALKRKQGKRSSFEVGITDAESETDSDNELYVTSENWPRFLLMKSASEECPLNKLSPFAIQMGFKAIARSLRGHQEIEGRLRPSRV